MCDGISSALFKFVWRQSELAFFSASATVGALFVFMARRITNLKDSGEIMTEEKKKAECVKPMVNSQVPKVEATKESANTPEVKAPDLKADRKSVV